MMHIRESPSPRQKTVPKNLPVPFIYHPSDDGTDENLLILLHGLGASLLVGLVLSSDIANIARGYSYPILKAGFNSKTASDCSNCTTSTRTVASVCLPFHLN